MSDVVWVGAITAGVSVATLMVNKGFDLRGEAARHAREEAGKENQHQRITEDSRIENLRKTIPEFFAFLTRFEVGMAAFEHPTNKNYPMRTQLLTYSLDHMESAARTAGMLQALEPGSLLGELSEQIIESATAIINAWGWHFGSSEMAPVPSDMPESQKFRAMKRSFMIAAGQALPPKALK